MTCILSSLSSLTALRDKRYKIINLSESDFSVSVSDVTFKDGGLYTCLHYTKVPVVKSVTVTVLGKYDILSYHCCL